jgi:hypothetical protein
MIKDLKHKIAYHVNKFTTPMVLNVNLMLSVRSYLTFSPK